jgi:hypothetical protein
MRGHRETIRVLANIISTRTDDPLEKPDSDGLDTLLADTPFEALAR